MANLKDDLASLRIEQTSRAGGSRRGVWIALALVAIAVAAGGWLWTTRVDAAPVTIATVTARTGVGAAPGAVLNASGYVTARRRATVSSKVTGKVLEVFVEEGTAVRKGQVLARLDDSQVRAALAVAEAQLEASRRGAAEDEARLREAELTLGRREQLIKEKIIGRAELDSARAEVESIKARISLSQQQVKVSESLVSQHRTDLADMTVRAPFDGVAISKDAQPGEMISPVSAGGGFTRSGIGTIVDMSSLEIEVDVAEQYISTRAAGPADRGGARRLQGLAHPGPRHHHRPVGRSAEGHDEGADRVRQARPADPPRHGRQGVLPHGEGAGRDHRAARAAARAQDGGANGGRA